MERVEHPRSKMHATEKSIFLSEWQNVNESIVCEIPSWTIEIWVLSDDIDRVVKNIEISRDVGAKWSAHASSMVTEATVNGVNGWAKSKEREKKKDILWAFFWVAFERIASEWERRVTNKSQVRGSQLWNMWYVSQQDWLPVVGNDRDEWGAGREAGREHASERGGKKTPSDALHR